MAISWVGWCYMGHIHVSFQSDSQSDPSGTSCRRGSARQGCGLLCDAAICAFKQDMEKGH